MTKIHGTAIIESDEVKKVSFTGSEIGGSRVATTAAKHVKPVTLELGGKSPQIVFRDADLENAINGIMSFRTMSTRVERR